MIVLLVIAYACIALSVLNNRREDEILRQKIDLVLKGKYPSAELVTGVGVYQVLKYGPDDMEKKRPVLIRGVVKMGIDINGLQVEYDPDHLIVTYPEIKVLSVEILNLVDMSGEVAGTPFYDEVLAMKRLFLKEEAKRRGLASQAERNLRNEIGFLVGEFAPESLVSVEGARGMNAGKERP